MLVEWDPVFDAVCGADIENVQTEPQEDSGVRDWLHGRNGVLGLEARGRGSTWASAAASYGMGTDAIGDEAH